jgi:HAD superfamily hydrolase (TIGR01490 family)
MGDHSGETEPGVVAFFDLDRTLIDCNSGRLWMAHERRAGRLPLKIWLQGMWWLLLYALGRDGLSMAYVRAVQGLAGKEEQRIAERTRRWFDEEVRHRLRPGAQEALNQHQLQGDRLVLATSSSSYISACAMEAFGLSDAVCTRFEVQDGVFTGRISEMAYGPEKADRVREWAQREGVSLEKAVFYTDSATDFAVLDMVGNPVVVNPDHRLRRLAEDREWPVVDWGSSKSI